MPTELVESKEAETAKQVIKYPIAEAAIAEMATEFMPLTIAGVDDKDGFKAVHDARMVVKNHRVAVEKTRKELKAEALAYGRSVDSEAKRLTELLAPIEEHLSAEESAIADEKEKIRQAAAVAARKQLDERLTALASVGVTTVGVSKLEEMSEEDFQTVLETATIRFNEQQAAAAKIEEEKRLAEEREKAERDAEAKLLAEEKARLDAESARLAAVQRGQEEAQAKIDAVKAQLAKEADEKLQQEKLAEAERAGAERAKAEAEAKHQENILRAKRLEELAEQERQREEACRPDQQKLLGVCLLLDGIIVPEVSPEMEDVRKCVIAILKGASRQIKDAVGDPVATPTNPFVALGS